MVSLNIPINPPEIIQSLEPERPPGPTSEANEDIDLREVYFLIIHFLSTGPCRRTYSQLLNELLEHRLLPRRYHAWYSKSGEPSGGANDDGCSLPLSYSNLVKRYPHIQRDHLVKLLKQLLLNCSRPSHGNAGGNLFPNASDVPTLLGSGKFSLLSSQVDVQNQRENHLPAFLRWPHIHADQVRALCLRELGGGFSKHHRAPAVRAACYAIAKPSTILQNMEIKKRLRGHQNAVYCAIFDRSGRHVITGSDDRLVKIWSMETAFCLACCRGHEGDITDLAVSSNNAIVASASNDFIIRIWRMPDGLPISVLRGHTGAVTAIAFSPRPSAVYQLLSSSDDGTCRIWDARFSQASPRVYVPKPLEVTVGKPSIPSTSTAAQQRQQILCCAFNANGTVFVTGSSDTYARVWNACKVNLEDAKQPNHEMDLLSGHENDVNYVQFSGCSTISRSTVFDTCKEDNLPKFKNSWFTHDNIVTCSRDGSAIIWIPRSRRYHGKSGRWTRAYHLRVPPPPMPPQPPRGGPRQRFQPTPRGVNMIIWSLDNRFVLAAIMDCRICVWNASDGSLVHSLMGHSQSTFVLDVHPFNPRIAMSAGYDGKTIIWDIWEGTPVRIYETGHFKLVDGKFSPDGTSIVLSDEVGQILVIATGQGDSLEDAKYDQFFLGDYRPLIQDTHGNILDQETQLPPHRRNMQDLLCDSSLIPYPEPYQSMYQRRRLGALGIEWHPPSLNFAVGPADGVGGVAVHIPFIDPERLLEPVPEFLDTVDWEQEIEVQSSDTDSEYDATEEFSSEADHESASVAASGDSMYSQEDSEELVCGAKDGLRRSRRKSQRPEIEEITTSSGRRVKRRNLDERDGAAVVGNTNQRTRKPRVGRSKRKSSKSVSLRPQRRAARNALSLFSQITEASSEGDEEEEAASETDTSESGSALQDSYSQGNESDFSANKSQAKSAKLKDVLVAERHHDQGDKDTSKASSSQLRAQPTVRRLVVKFSVKDRKETTPETSNLEENRPVMNGNCSASYEPGETSAYALENGSREEQRQLEKPVEQPEEPSGYSGSGTIKWGEVKTRSTKRPRFDDRRLKMDDLPSLKENGVRGGGEEEKEKIKEEEQEDKDAASVLEAFANSRAEKEHSPGSLESDYTPALVDQPIRVSNGLGKDAQMVDIVTDQESHAQPSCKKLKIRSGRAGQPIEREQSQEHDDNDWDDAKGLSSEDPYAKKYKSAHRGRRRGGEESPSAVEEEDDDCDQRSLRRRRENSALASSSNGYGARSMRGSAEEVELENGFQRRSSLRTGVGLRSHRSKRESYGACSDLGRRRPFGSAKKASWLLLAEHEEGYRYIPQLGDEVAYLRQGHEEYLKATRGLEEGPWKMVKGGRLRVVELCRVSAVEYSTLAGSGESCCKLSLELLEEGNGAKGKSFILTLPELLAFPDFLVERSRYEAAIARNWTHRDKCRVWWRDEDGRGGGWWEGRVVAVRAKCSEFPDSPWERYVVQYKSDSSGQHLHSPWELHDPPSAGDGHAPAWEHPRLQQAVTQALLAGLGKLHKNHSEIYQKLNQVALKSDFLNRFPVPLSPEVIRRRAESGYYRTAEAVRHDASVMLSNAASYLGKSAELSSKLRRFSDAITRAFSSL
ncbi:uncharacterized protein LOC144700843 [Wolffia australiana]